ncbi:MAG: cold shock domain-containing protein [Gammaproteobacteria bacterium]|nr:MAG: cold shock domain-containing protein [Gammaproteobacteria bacterium]
MPKGTVKYFNQQKGFGLIHPHDGSSEIFYHMNDAIEFVNVDQQCEYEIVETVKGFSAVGVKKLVTDFDSERFEN